MICCIVVVLAILFHRFFYVFCYVMIMISMYVIILAMAYALLFVVVTFEKSKIVTSVM